MAVHPIEYRYFTEEMRDVFSEEAKLQRWLDVEAALAKAHSKLGTIPLEAAREIEKKADIRIVTVDRVKEIEDEIHHDLMAMVKALSEKCGTAGKYVHYGSTSYDIEDTALSMQLRDGIDIFLKRLEGLKKVLLKLAKEHIRTVCTGRTHGQHAVPTTYGLKFANYACEIQRDIDRLRQARERVLVGKMTGAVGTQASFGKKGRELQNLVMKSLGLEPVMVSTQVIQRDRHAEVIFVLALTASTMEKVAKEIRNLQRTEIGEVMEPFGSMQVGSSTMPHKRNPWKSERVCGLSRIVRGLVYPAIENNPLEHERDLTNSAPERVMFAEAFILTDFMATELTKILSGLEFNRGRIRKNLKMTGGFNMAEHVMIGLVEKGVGRQEAHELVRSSSMKAYKSGRSLREELISNETIKRKLTGRELDKLLDPDNYIGTAVEQVESVLKTLG